MAPCLSPPPPRLAVPPNVRAPLKARGRGPGGEKSARPPPPAGSTAPALPSQSAHIDRHTGKPASGAYEGRRTSHHLTREANARLEGKEDAEVSSGRPNNTENIVLLPTWIISSGTMMSRTTGMSRAHAADYTPSSTIRPVGFVVKVARQPWTREVME